LPGGTSYNVVAHYEGNGTDAPSDSSPVTVTVTVAAEPSKVFITVPTFDPTTGKETGTSPTTLVYGSSYILRADVTNATGSLAALCKPPSCPSGTITFADSVGGVSQGAPNSGAFSLNGSGYTEDLPVQFPGGTNVITATYSGDGSFSPPGTPTMYTLNVTAAPTQMAVPVVPSMIGLATVPVNISSYLISNLLSGAAPGGTITFFDGATPMTGPVMLTPRAGGGGLDASVNGVLTVTFPTSGSHSITAKYSGDGSYAASTSPATALKVAWQTTMAATETPNNVIFGQPVQVTATVTTLGKSPVMTGTFQIENTNLSFPGTPSVDGNGNQTFSASFSVTPGSDGTIPVVYSGDANYGQSSVDLFVQVTTPDFSITTNASALAVTASQQQATATLTITPLSTAQSTVVLNCALPDVSAAACTIAPSTVTLSGGQPAKATLTYAVNGSSTTSPNAVKAKAKRRAALTAWLDSDWWEPGWAAIGLAMIFFSLLPGFWRNRKLRIAVAACSVVFFAVACGGGGGSGSSSNLNPTPQSVATTTTVTFVNPKVPASEAITATATITSTNPVSGSVEFFATNSVAPLSELIAVQQKKATTTLTLPGIGIYPVYAKYMGDSLNQKSQSQPVPATITGTYALSVAGTTGSVVHQVPMTISVE
jgi:hypothetical protein